MRELQGEGQKRSGQAVRGRGSRPSAVSHSPVHSSAPRRVLERTDRVAARRCSSGMGTNSNGAYLGKSNGGVQANRDTLLGLRGSLKLPDEITRSVS